LHNRCPPPAELRVIERERHHRRMFGQNRLHRAPQVANTLAMNDPHLEDAPLPACGR
jgi:hypothetical protein